MEQLETANSTIEQLEYYQRGQCDVQSIRLLTLSKTIQNLKTVLI